MPLLLGIAILTYQEIATKQWQKLPSSADLLQCLQDAYVRQMLTREINNKAYVKQKPPNDRQTRLWLVWLAQQMQQESQTEFLIEKIKPSLLKTSTQKRLSRLLLVLLCGLIG